MMDQDAMSSEDDAPGYKAPTWMETIRRKFPHWDAQLKQFKLRLTGRPLAPLEFLEVQDLVSHRLRQARAPATWSNIASVINQFHSFDTQQRVAGWDSMPLDLRMIHFVEWKTLHGLQLSSALLYAKKLAQLHTMTGGDSDLLREYMQSLRRDPASVPEGASPLTPSQVRTVLQKAARRTDVIYCQILCALLLAARMDDLNRLTGKSFTLEEGQLWVLWSMGTKSGPDKRADVIVRPPQRLLDHIYNTAAQPFPLKHSAITAILRNMLPDAEVSSHSLKKTALVHLLSQRIPASQVAFKAKHADECLIQTYVGPMHWAKAQGIVNMGEVLNQLVQSQH